jgi:hypothetical protein
MTLLAVESSLTVRFENPFQRGRYIGSSVADWIILIHSSHVSIASVSWEVLVVTGEE